MEIVVAFVLGAGVAIAARGRGRLARRSLGWMAEKAGWISAHAATALDEARDAARKEFERGRDGQPPTVVEDKSGVTKTTNGHV
jgi:hypothetical protein